MKKFFTLALKRTTSFNKYQIINLDVVNESLLTIASQIIITALSFNNFNYNPYYYKFSKHMYVSLSEQFDFPKIQSSIPIPVRIIDALPYQFPSTNKIFPV